MSSAGFISTMISSLKNNARLKKSMFDKENRKFLKRNDELTKKLLAQKASPEQLMEIKKQLEKENALLLIKKIAASIITVFILVLLLWLIF